MQAILYDEISLNMHRLELLAQRTQLIDYIDELLELNQQLTLEIGDLGGSTALGLQIEEDFEVLMHSLGKW